MIGIIGAMKKEIDDLKARVENAETVTVSGIEFVTGSLQGTPVVLAVCGIGKVFAAICAQTMCVKFGVSAIINTGVGGTLCPELGIGDVAIASAVVQHDMDTSPLGDPVGLISGINVVEMPADAALAALAEQAAQAQGHHTCRGIIATGDQFISSDVQRDRIRSHFPAIAAEMEGGAIGQVCYVNKVPFAVIRVISDDANGNSPQDYPAFAVQAGQTGMEITLAVMKALGGN